MADSLYVIDSTFLLEASHNAFYGAPLLHESSGCDTTMLFGFARDLLRLRKQLGIRKALIVIGDTGSCLPGPLVSDSVDLLKRLRVPVLYANGVRVGDLCAALAEHCTWIITGNKAMLQLINDRCGVILSKKGGELDDIYFDTMLAAGECFGDWEFFNLGEVARRLLGTKIKRYSDIVEKEQTLLDVPFKDLIEHACTDADMSLRYSTV